MLNYDTCPGPQILATTMQLSTESTHYQEAEEGPYARGLLNYDTCLRCKTHLTCDIEDGTPAVIKSVGTEVTREDES